MRYALDVPMTPAKWDAEPLNRIPVLKDPYAYPSIDNIMSSAPSGQPESMEVSGLAANTTYYFGIKVSDEVGNWSELASAAGETTKSAGPGDWAIDIANPDCSGGCGQRNDIDVDATGRIGTWYAADVSVTNLDDDAPITTAHVGDLDGSAESLGNKWKATITILVHDADHSPVADATVSGSWGAGASGTASCTTNGSGVCTVTSAAVKNNRSTITFAVDDVGHASLTYDAADNHDPDGDSDGTTITVNKP